MYTEKEREDVLNNLVNKFKNRDDILGVIQVGSGVNGYKDIYSDLDFAVVVNDSSIENVFNKTYNNVREDYDIVFFNNMKERSLQLFLLDNYLELDMGYYTLDSLFARGENYKILFDKTGLISDIMEKSCSKIDEKNKDAISEVNMKDTIGFIEFELWYNVLHSVIAFKRNNKYRCYYELLELKDYAIDLITKRNNLKARRFRQIEEFSNEELVKVNKLFSYPKDYIELEDYLKNVLKIIFDEFDYWKEKENISYKDVYEFYINFIKENRENI